MSIAENIAQVRRNIDEAAREAGRTGADIVLVGASKMNGVAACREAVAAGIDALGENRVQEMVQKLSEHAYDGAPLHFIGHLQRNKVRLVVGHVDLIQSVGSEPLLREIEKAAARLDGGADSSGSTDGMSGDTAGAGASVGAAGTGASAGNAGAAVGNVGASGGTAGRFIQPILLEVNIGGEAAKSGFAPEELFAAAETALTLPHIQVRGLMTIPPADADRDENRRYFDKVRRLFVDMAENLFHNRLEYLSMGMSGDYQDAVRAGATMVRVGTSIFGARNY